MVEAMKRTEMEEVEIAVPPLQLPDAASTAELVLTETLEFCAQKMGLDSPQAVIDHLQQSDRFACGYYHYGLGKRVAASLGALDEKVKSVYIYDYNVTSEDICLDQITTQPSPIHLIVWAERKTSALNSLAAALNHALVQECADRIGPNQLKHLLDVQVIDDAEVKNQVGYGALLCSLHNRPVKVWER